jgi:XRE family transcriptional regulator, aerobic/anaerobic benzoate catabolism transcriptional regulator
MNQTAGPEESTRDAFLSALGERVRALRHRRGMTRKRLAEAAGVSERHLANLETGQGNASVMLLRDLARALGSSIGEIVGEDAVASGESARIRDLLRGRDEATLARARKTLAEALGAAAADSGRDARIALIGLRGAGKSTLGRMLAEDLRVPFVELDRVVERMAGCDVGEIHSLYGAGAFRRYELRALEDTIAAHGRAVIATGGGLVTEPSTYDLLLSRCFTVWLRASPDDHMKRVIAQGDLRPMAGNAEAMDDLKRILAARENDYARADLTFDTSAAPLAQVYMALRDAIGSRMPIAA